MSEINYDIEYDRYLLSHLFLPLDAAIDCVPAMSKEEFIKKCKEYGIEQLIPKVDTSKYSTW